MSSIALRSFLVTSLILARVPVYGENTPHTNSRSPDMVGLFSQADQHWAFQAPKQGRLPPEDIQPWARTAIDRLISRRLGEHGLGPASSAGKRTLLRRLYYDLVGLSPSAQEVQRFQEDQSPEAYRRVVDRLLASSQFGEKWGRHWLDVARYGDTKGYVFEADREYSHAYRYRDWVVDALNRDMPYDHFVRLQLAADLMEGSNHSENLAAVGFLTLVRGSAAGGDYVGNAGRGDIMLGYQLGLPRSKASEVLNEEFFENLRRNAGPIYTYSRCSAKKVQDGLSKTIAIGEKHISSQNVAGSYRPHWELGDTAIFSGDSPHAIFGTAAGGIATGPEDVSRTKFGSEHLTVIHFVFLDGHVGLIDRNITKDALGRLAAVSDGELTDVDFP